MALFKEVVERAGMEIKIILQIEWRYSRGEYLEPGHRHNGHGKGWYCSKLNARVDDLFGRRGAFSPVELTEAEIDTFTERYSAERIRGTET